MAENAQLTRCKSGLHELTSDNVIVRPFTRGDGTVNYTRRGCRRCKEARNTARYKSDMASSAKVRLCAACRIDPHRHGAPCLNLVGAEPRDYVCDCGHPPRRSPKASHKLRAAIRQQAANGTTYARLAQTYKLKLDYIRAICGGFQGAE